MVACWMWWTGRAPYQFPLSIGFLFVLALFLLSQNTQTTGLPSALVIVFMLYDQLCRQFAGSRSRDVTPLLLTLMVFPAISVAVSAMTLINYHLKATDTRALYVVDRTNLRGLAVPSGERGTFATFPRGDEGPSSNQRGPLVERYDFSQYEYVEMLLEAVDVLAGLRGERQLNGIALLDQVDPLSFMLSVPPVRGANLWSIWTRPPPPADVYLPDVHYVLIPKFPIPPNWTAGLVDFYRDYLADHFERAVESPSWIVLRRFRPGNSTPSNAPFLQ